MPDRFDRAKRSDVMRSVRSHNTRPEIVVRQLLHRLGFRFRLQRKDLPGRPDIVLPRHRKVILVHGCFWHQHDNCERAARPESNADFWNRKLDRNVQRDAENVAALSAAGWKVLVLWECQTEKEEPLRKILRRFLR